MQQHAGGVDDRREQRAAQRLGPRRRLGDGAVGDRLPGDVDGSGCGSPGQRPGQRVDRRRALHRRRRLRPPIGARSGRDPSRARSVSDSETIRAEIRWAGAVGSGRCRWPCRSSGSIPTCRSPPTPTPATPGSTCTPARTPPSPAGGGRALVPTGIAIAMPPGHAGFVLPRSGLALRHGIGVVNSPGLIDAAYRGEVKVVLLNTDPTSDYHVHRGDRIAQLVVQRVDEVEWQVVDDARRRRPRRRLRPLRPLTGRITSRRTPAARSRPPGRRGPPGRASGTARARRRSGRGSGRCRAAPARPGGRSRGCR